MVGTHTGRRQFDDWIRGDFASLNTSLETLYRTGRAGQGGDDASSTESLRETLLLEGRQHIAAVLEGRNEWGDPEEQFDLLGNVGLYMSACKRHGLNEGTDVGRSPLVEASRLARKLGTSLGVAPRFLAAHLSTFNRARGGVLKVFTRFQAESIFLEFNVRGILAFQEAAANLEDVANLGISNPVSLQQLQAARSHLDRVRSFNDLLYDQLDVETFFYSIRPYYVSHLVGAREYRGANAGDFAGINQIDLLLGLCSARDPFYAEILAEKQPYILPRFQEAIERSVRLPNLLDRYLKAISREADASWLEPSLEAYLEVCRAHGRAAASHHNKLVHRFIEKPAQELPPERLHNITASGPPLNALLSTLERLRDLRLARDRQGIHSRHADIQSLKDFLKASP